MTVINIILKKDLTSYTITDEEEVVCGNIYEVRFFDTDISNLKTAIARFIYNDFCYDKKILSKTEGGQTIYYCETPRIDYANTLSIGVYFGDGEDALKKSSSMVKIPLKPAIKQKTTRKSTLSQKEYVDKIKVVRDDLENTKAKINTANKEIGQWKELTNPEKLYEDIERLESKIDEELFITDNTIAYTKVAPNNVEPYAEIKQVGGMTYKDSTQKILSNAAVT